jgi:uridine kinase
MTLEKNKKKMKLVIISGLTTSGKTTSSYELARALPGWLFIDNWKIKEIFEPLGLKDRTELLKITKKAVLLITREVIRKMDVNIILQEAKRDYVQKKLGKDLKKYNYNLYSFFLKNKFKDAVKRDIKRKKPTLGIGTRGWTNWNKRMDK